MNFFKKTLLLNFFLCISVQAYAQTDSLTVFFKVVGPKHEKFDVYFKGIHVLSAPRGGLSLSLFKVSVNSSLKSLDRLDFYISKAQFFGLFYKDVSIGIAYEAKYKYLVIERDAGRKNSSPIISYWGNERPSIYK